MVYLWCMGVVAATALPMAVFRPVPFLALVAIFSFYAAFAGYRVLRLKDLPRGGSAKPIDWIAAVITFCGSGVLVWMSWFHPRQIQVIPVVGVVLGAVGISLAFSQMRTFVRKPKDKMFCWYDHLGNFIGSYIAAWTAFGVVTLTRFVGNHWWVWLWPTMVGLPAIIVTSAYYRRKFAPRRPAEAVAAM
jgi:VanZ family protein